MSSMFLQVESPSIMFRDLLEPIAGPLSVSIVLGLIVYAFVRRRNYNRRLYNAIMRPTIIYLQAPNSPPSSSSVIESPSNTKKEFNKLSWTQKEVLYRNRIIQLRDANRKLRALLKEAGLPSD